MWYRVESASGYEDIEARNPKEAVCKVLDSSNAGWIFRCNKLHKTSAKGIKRYMYQYRVRSQNDKTTYYGAPMI